MTAEPFITIWCDEDFDPETGHRPCLDFYDSGDRTAAVAREHARPYGWRHVPGPSRDFCPEHAEARAL